MKIMSLGRLGRFAFLVGLLIGPIVFGIFLFLKVPNSVLGLLSLIWLVWILLLFIARLHDVNQRTWVGICTAFLCAVPILNIIIFILLCAKPGNTHPNDYGAPPNGSLGDLLRFWQVE